MKHFVPSPSAAVVLFLLHTGHAFTIIPRLWTPRLATMRKNNLSVSRPPIMLPLLFHQPRAKSSVAVLQGKGDDQQDHDPTVLPEKAPQDKDNELIKGIAKIWLGIQFIFGYLFQALGFLLSIGLLLNIFGYGYQITPQGELRVDTIQTFRKENQFRKEVQKSMKEYRQQENELLEKSNTLPTE